MKSEEKRQKLEAQTLAETKKLQAIDERLDSLPVLLVDTVPEQRGDLVAEFGRLILERNAQKAILHEVLRRTARERIASLQAAVEAAGKRVNTFNEEQLLPATRKREDLRDQIRILGNARQATATERYEARQRLSDLKVEFEILKTHIELDLIPKRELLRNERKAAAARLEEAEANNRAQFG